MSASQHAAGARPERPGGLATGPVGSLARSARSSSSGRPTTRSADVRGTPQRSCEACHRRKVRCDKGSPCSACTRGRVACSYPATAWQPIRRARKTTMADVVSRISDLQKSIAATDLSRHRNPTSASPDTVITRAASPISVADGIAAVAPSRPLAVGNAQGTGSDHMLLSNGAPRQYVNEYLLSRVLDEDEDKSSLLSSQQKDEPESVQDSPFSLMGILSDPMTVANGSSQGTSFVSKRSAMFLWNTYCINVEACIRVLHVPTAEGLIFSAIDNPGDATKDALALLNAIFFAALASLEDSEVRSSLGMDRLAALKKAKAQLHCSFSVTDFLDFPSMTVLQALVIYLTVVRNQNRGQGVWNLSGLALRVAQSLGMHRDGTKLGLSPFETEIRRRLWWHLVVRDGRAAEDYGINSPSATPGFDTELPLNIEDADLTPEMTTPPLERNGWTGMTYPLVAINISHAMRRLSILEMSGQKASWKESERSRIMKELKTILDTMLQSCNSAIPIQKAALLVASLVFTKVDLMTRHQAESRVAEGMRKAAPAENDLIAACECLETSNDLWFDELLRHYRWLTASYPQTHLLLYVYWHLCLCPKGPTTDRAWKSANIAKDVEIQKQETSLVPKHSFKSVVLDRLKRRAELVRDSVSDDSQEEQHYHHQQGARREGQDATASSFTAMGLDDGAISPLPENVEWANIIQGIPDWTTLVEDLLSIVPA